MPDTNCSCRKVYNSVLHYYIALRSASILQSQCEGSIIAFDKDTQVFFQLGKIGLTAKYLNNFQNTLFN